MMRKCVLFFIINYMYSGQCLILSCVELHSVRLPVELKVGVQGLFGHRWRDVCLSDGFLGSVSSDEVKLHQGLGDIDDGPDFVVFLGFVADVDGLVLLADGAVVAVVADAVGAFEGKLLVLVPVSDDAHHDVVVLDEHDLDVEVEPTLAGHRLAVEELVGGPVQLLNVAVVDAEFGVVLAQLVHLEHQLLPELLELLGLLATAQVGLLHRRVLLREARLLRVVFRGLQVIQAVLEVADPVGQLQVLALLVLQGVAQAGRGELQLLNAALPLPQGLLQLLCLPAFLLESLLQVPELPPEPHLSSELHLLQRQIKLLEPVDDMHADNNRPVLHPNLIGTVLRNEEVDLLHVLEDDLELHRQSLIGVAAHQPLQLFSVFHFKGNCLPRTADADSPAAFEDGLGQLQHCFKNIMNKSGARFRAPWRIRISGLLQQIIILQVELSHRIGTSFLLAGCLLGVLLALAGRGLIGGFFLLGLALGLEGGLLLLHDFLVLLNRFCVHLDGGVAEAAVVSVPVLGHEGAGTAGGTGLALLGHVALAWVKAEVPSMPQRVQMESLTRLWMCLLFFLVVQTFFFFFFLPPSRSPVTYTLAPSASAAKPASSRLLPCETSLAPSWSCCRSCWQEATSSGSEVPSSWLSQIFMLWLIIQQFIRLIHIKSIQLLIQIMLTRTLARIINRRSIRTGFATEKKDEPLQEETQKERQREREEREEEGREEEEDPLREQNRNTVGWWIYRFFFWGGFSVLSYNTYLAYTHDKKTPVEDEPGAIPYVIDVAKAITHQLNEMTEMVTQPPLSKLLPDPVHPDFHPKTLVLNLTGTLVKTEYIFGKGNRTVLRPGVENLLRRLVQKYEIIVFADEEAALMANALNSVDPQHRFISCLLGKESMVWRSGSYIKDLKYLNRDLKKIIIVDRRKENVKSQPENLILLSDYDGSAEDTEINKLLVLLERLAGPEVTDVRKQLAKLGDDPLNAFYEKMKEKQKKLQQKSGVFGIFNGPAKKQPTSQRDL